VTKTPGPELRKYTLSVEEKGGVIFASSKDFEDLFIAVLSRDELRPAIDCCLQNVFAETGQTVKVYLNCEFTGPTVDAVVELAG
jgi:hypothetical protein